MILDDKTRELIAVGASVAANSAPSLKLHVERAKSFGLSEAEIKEAVETGKFVRRGAASKTDIFAESLGTPPPRGRCSKWGANAPEEKGCGCEGSASAGNSK